MSRQERSHLPSALDQFERLIAETGGRRPAVFLDYDGVLTPIVDHPDLAILSEAMRSVVAQLAESTDVAVISGRDTADVKAKVALDGVWYAGSHGFDIVGPDGHRPGDSSLDRFEQYIEPLEAAADRIESALLGLDGAHVERKRFAVAVHFRQAPETAETVIADLVSEITEEDDRLQMTTGKKIFELRPAVEWDKGKALEWLIPRLGIDLDGSVPFYLGDDVTDEDAFAVLVDTGIGIVVGLDGEPSLASYVLDDPDEVRMLLAKLADSISP